MQWHGTQTASVKRTQTNVIELESDWSLFILSFAGKLKAET